MGAEFRLEPYMLIVGLFEQCEGVVFVIIIFIINPIFLVITINAAITITVISFLLFFFVTIRIRFNLELVEPEHLTLNYLPVSQRVLERNFMKSDGCYFSFDFFFLFFVNDRDLLHFTVLLDVDDLEVEMGEEKDLFFSGVFSKIVIRKSYMCWWRIFIV